MFSSKYYFFPPKAPQFYFPQKNFKYFKQFYAAHSLKAKLFWFIFSNIELVRYCFSINENRIPLPINSIKEIIDIKNAYYFFNLGTQGEEQKATVIAFNKEEAKFLKFGQTALANSLILNETQTLLKLSGQKITVPKVLANGTYKGNNYLCTNVIKANKVKRFILNKEVKKLINQVNNVFPHKTNQCIKVFSHGDFCPWNMLQKKEGELILIDWEKAGYKPLGHDLFTYIFQSTFLLSPQNSISNIIGQYKYEIHSHFNNYGVSDWKYYLRAFAKLKLTEEKYKQNSELMERYRDLLNYNEKN